MLKIKQNKFEVWFLPYRRILLMGMLAANVCLPLVLIGWQDQPTQVGSIYSQAVAEIHLVDEIGVPSGAGVHEPYAECRRWGPEADPAAFDGLIAQLDQQDGEPDIRTSEVPVAPDYLVYIGGFGTNGSINRVIEKLNDQRIDSYVIKRENAAPILSVGVFSRQEYAELQLTTVEKLGYKGFIEELPKSKTVYNLTAHVRIASELYKSSNADCMTFAHYL